MPFDWLIDLFSGALGEFSDYEEVGQVSTSCEVEERRPTVSVIGRDEEAVGDKADLKAFGHPWAANGTYSWEVISGTCTLEKKDSSRIWASRTSPGRVTIGVTYTVGDLSSKRAAHTVEFKTPIRLPKLLHFIWAGGSRIMPRPSFKNVVDWAVANPDFRVVLWVDRATDSNAESKYRSTYASLLKNAKNVVFEDIHNRGVETEHARYEIERLWPNYGSSSDLLRYAILERYGGVYFDADVYPGKWSLNEVGLFDCKHLAPVFLANDRSQGSRSIGNDAFICTPNHPWMRKILTQSQAHYKELGYYLQQNCAERSHQFGYRMTSTVERTGPTAVGRVLAEEGAMGDPLEVTKIADEPFFRVNGTYYLNQLPSKHRIDQNYVRISEEQSNTLGWMKVPIKKMSLTEAIKVAAMEMRFEIEKMGMLCIMDHVAQIVVAAEQELKNAKAERGYSTRVLSIDPQAEVENLEILIVRRLFEALTSGYNLDPNKIKPNYQKNPYVLEAKCRYGDFRKFYDAIKS